MENENRVLNYFRKSQSKQEIEEERERVKALEKENAELRGKVKELTDKLCKQKSAEMLKDERLKKLNGIEVDYDKLTRKHKDLKDGIKRVEKVLSDMGILDKVNAKTQAIKLASKVLSKITDMGDPNHEKKR
ncbi:hypothetical protein [Clostridium beijerinckii]|uniref:Uncharacterized protein n=1 Tax=Clostridium beijerinckii TaxID=1520 RepID=A0AAW3WGM1_CLOBE|nr:hypothetical protein [Clostridium beijerinckii]MBC2460399.1 hypothetical protein [Clostridium beijerinckii]MBC2477876.1 hypothetical protein [Clostridium beijerinckii]NOV63573.1 putative nuclease with TOPRIM domain [Clostridium beijerinckii]NOV73428.1 putative nuclease with TOPRIM domain [Clostridium beijerinckii]NOW35457.1 putative nuclease with TOPRIM domain [Clostridium beijerinckii]